MSSHNHNVFGPAAYRHARYRKLLPLSADATPDLGAHLVTPWFGFAHHGIYVGDGRVIQYGALMFNLIRKPVEEVSLERFASGRRMYVVQHAERCMSALEVITRARSRLGEKDYRLLTNNCEHFVEWCLHDESRSFQAETALAYPRALGERIETALLGVVRRVVVARTPARVRIEERQEQERR